VTFLYSPGCEALGPPGVAAIGLVIAVISTVAGCGGAKVLAPG